MKMAMTVKKLISELEKIENKFLEVEVYAIENKYMMYELDSVRKVDKKVLIFTKDNRRS
jgi:hypothetical protein